MKSVCIAVRCIILGLSITAIGQNSESLAQVTDEAMPFANAEHVCAAHGPGCSCLGCRAFFDRCGSPCPIDCPPDCPSMIPYSPYEGVGQPPTAEEEGTRESSDLPEGLRSGLSASPENSPLSGPITSLSGGMGALAQGGSATPSMIGDFFGLGYTYNAPFPNASVTVAAGDRILKFADNNSPLPQDRVFFNYHNFQNSITDIDGNVHDTNRFTFGIEKTFWSGMGSVEFRLPFAAGVSASQTQGSGDFEGTEFGNLAFAVKMLVIEKQDYKLAAGLGMVLPTAADSPIYGSEGELLVSFNNDSFYLQPFIGVYRRPSCRRFSQFVSQISFDVTGSEFVSTDISPFGQGTDRLYTQTLLYLDYSTGYWIYRAPDCGSFVRGVAPMIELHYTTTLDSLDLPDFNPDTFENDLRRDALNLTGGLLFDLSRRTSLKLAGVAPLRDGSDKLFDSEFSMQLIRYY